MKNKEKNSIAALLKYKLVRGGIAALAVATTITIGSSVYKKNQEQPTTQTKANVESDYQDDTVLPEIFEEEEIESVATETEEPTLEEETKEEEEQEEIEVMKPSTKTTVAKENKKPSLEEKKEETDVQKEEEKISDSEPIVEEPTTPSEDPKEDEHQEEKKEEPVIHTHSFSVVSKTSTASVGSGTHETVIVEKCSCGQTKTTTKTESHTYAYVDNGADELGTCVCGETHTRDHGSLSTKNTYVDKKDGTHGIVPVETCSTCNHEEKGTETIVACQPGTWADNDTNEKTTCTDCGQTLYQAHPTITDADKEKTTGSWIDGSNQHTVNVVETCPSCGHTNSYTEEANCTLGAEDHSDKTQVTQTCTDCGHVYVVHSHKYTAGEKVKVSTEDVCYTITYTCSCGESYTDEFEHESFSENEALSTLESIRMECDFCNYSYDETLSMMGFSLFSYAEEDLEASYDDEMEMSTEEEVIEETFEAEGTVEEIEEEIQALEELREEIIETFTEEAEEDYTLVKE